MQRNEYNFLFDMILPENNLLRKFSTLAEGLPPIIQIPIRIAFNKLATILRYVQHNIE